MERRITETSESKKKGEGSSGLEKRMHLKYPHMPETMSEMEERWHNDPEIRAEVAEAMKDDRFLNQRRS
jgi:hypothetical protein